MLRFYLNTWMILTQRFCYSRCDIKTGRNRRELREKPVFELKLDRGQVYWYNSENRSNFERKRENFNFSFFVFLLEWMKLFDNDANRKVLCIVRPILDREKNISKEKVGLLKNMENRLEYFLDRNRELKIHTCLWIGYSSGIFLSDFNVHFKEFVIYKFASIRKNYPIHRHLWISNPRRHISICTTTPFISVGDKRFWFFQHEFIKKNKFVLYRGTLLCVDDVSFASSLIDKSLFIKEPVLPIVWVYLGAKIQAYFHIYNVQRGKSVFLSIERLTEMCNLESISPTLMQNYAQLYWCTQLRSNQLGAFLPIKGRWNWPLKLQNWKRDKKYVDTKILRWGSKVSKLVLRWAQ